MTDATRIAPDLAARIEIYLDDMPSDGAHSDAAGGNCWDLLREALHELRTSPSLPERVADDIVNRLRFDAARCEIGFSKGIAKNIEEAADEIERLRKALVSCTLSSNDGQ